MSPLKISGDRRCVVAASDKILCEAHAGVSEITRTIGINKLRDRAEEPPPKDPTVTKTYPAQLHTDGDALRDKKCVQRSGHVPPDADNEARLTRDSGTIAILGFC